MLSSPSRLRFPLLAAAVLAVALATVAAPVRADAPAPAVKALKTAKPERVLFVGNSYLYYNDSLHNHVRRMVAASGLSNMKTLKYKSATISGAMLFDHNIDSYLEPGKLRVKDPFQLVVLQGFSAAATKKGHAPKFAATVAEFAKKIQAAGGETALYMTHAYTKAHKKYDPEMIRAIEKLYVETGNTVGALVIPVGLAFEEAYKRRPDMKLQQSYDGSHPDLAGTYLAACVVFASVYGQSPVGNSYDYFGEIDKDTAQFLQQVADDTVKKFYGR
jgi:hypothetical protein